MSELFEDPLTPKNGLTLTPFHITTLLLSSLVLFLSSTTLPSPFSLYIGMLKRIMVILVMIMIGHHVVVSQMDRVQKRWEIAREKENRELESLQVKAELKKKPDDWENASAHPSHFLTTRDGKPRLFPFPLGKAGGMGNKELWWEAGNSAHVGHFNQRETPEMLEQLRLETEGKEKARQAKAKKALKKFEARRAKWTKRLTHLKIISGIVVVGLVNRKIAVVCLAGYIYYTFAMHLAEMLKVEKKEEEGPAKKKKKIPAGPGMAMTYIYEPTPEGPKEAGAFPTRSPSHRLTTSFDSRYAS
ncbi:hypothetical protein IAR55_005700 [Kwoniella newhampshirensis]|uniref:Uncharacterized protein n=1 Tax=Kwoniella newhampshirensis TaxID=1651941 RepID=A0AAW0YJJ9_9TREE